MDPHSFSLLDPDPHSICGSGSRRVKISTENWKNARKLLITANLLSFLRVHFYKLHCFLILSNLLCFLQLVNSVADPNPGCGKMFVMDPDPGQTLIQIRIQAKMIWIRIQENDTDSTDPDTQHCWLILSSFIKWIPVPVQGNIFSFFVPKPKFRYLDANVDERSLK